MHFHFETDDDLGVYEDYFSRCTQRLSKNKRAFSAERQSFEQNTKHMGAYRAQKITASLQQIFEIECGRSFTLSEILVIIECLIAKTEKAVAEVVDDIDSAFLSSIVTFTDHTDCAIAIEVA